MTSHFSFILLTQFLQHVAKKVSNVHALNNEYLIELIGLRGGFELPYQQDRFNGDFRS